VNSTLGASLSYLFSSLFFRSLATRYFQNRIRAFDEQVERYRGKLFWYLLFLRITPLVPNWFINIASPLIGIPYKPFCFATFFGVMPAVAMFVQTGLTLQNLSTSADLANSFSSILFLLALGVLSLIPSHPRVQAMLSGLLHNKDAKS